MSKNKILRNEFNKEVKDLYTENHKALLNDKDLNKRRENPCVLRLSTAGERRGGAVARTPGFRFCGPHPTPGEGCETPQATRCNQNKKRATYC